VQPNRVPPRAYEQSVWSGANIPSDTGARGSSDLSSSAFKLFMLMWPESSAQALATPAARVNGAMARSYFCMMFSLSRSVVDNEGPDPSLQYRLGFKIASRRDPLGARAL
jgi:hypothetical protein